MLHLIFTFAKSNQFKEPNLQSTSKIIQRLKINLNGIILGKINDQSIAVDFELSNTVLLKLIFKSILTLFHKTS
jgi:hypothetical protein